jgi:hypothetical protein
MTPKFTFSPETLTHPSRRRPNPHHPATTELGESWIVFGLLAIVIAGSQRWFDSTLIIPTGLKNLRSTTTGRPPERRKVVSGPMMPFGKYEGVPLRDVPTSYLEWLERNISLRDPLKSQVRAILEARECYPDLEFTDEL